jgi:hypothetical protein
MGYRVTATKISLQFLVSHIELIVSLGVGRLAARSQNECFKSLLPFPASLSAFDVKSESEWLTARS